MWSLEIVQIKLCFMTDWPVLRRTPWPCRGRRSWRPKWGRSFSKLNTKRAYQEIGCQARNDHFLHKSRDNFHFFFLNFHLFSGFHDEFPLKTDWKFEHTWNSFFSYSSYFVNYFTGPKEMCSLSIIVVAIGIFCSQLCYIWLLLFHEIEVGDKSCLFAL